MTSTTMRNILLAALASAALVLSGCAAATEDPAPEMEAAPAMTEVIVVG